ncbi:Nitrogen permease reactivator protein [Coemansia javaensis]|uniref:non-specific serine/threonine protein kinase n=1 Tax=Coemansia javaensis TaxID=2761396 RepID=A0A9W8HE89_9FUNG|nr:Nitrogen permease reactivator protein [Coemansia javaensis]
MQSGRREVSPAHTLFDCGASGVSSASSTSAHGKKKFAHFRRLFSSLHKKSSAGHSRRGSADAHAAAAAAAQAGSSSGSNRQAIAQYLKQQDPPKASTVILRRPSTASSASTASDENTPVISDRPTGYILETYGLPVRTIGQGTGGYVKLHQACDGRYYAVKTFTFADPADRTKTTTAMNVRQWKHLLDEASFSLSLRHPNVIRTYQFVRENDGTVYSIMEYCERDLFTAVQDKSLTPDDTDRLFYQLLQGVAYLHEAARVAHRDMKLDNLCVDEEGNLKIIDFGCSSTFDPLAPAQTRGVCGSDPYIAPEVFVPRAMYDPRKVDVWALGIIYLAMISGHFPWEVAKDTDVNYAMYLRYRGRVIDHWLPKDAPANPLIKSALLIDPVDRPTVDVLLQDPWVASLAERFGAPATAVTSISKTSTLASSPADVKAVNDALATSAIYAKSRASYSSTSTVSSDLGIAADY